MCDQPVPSSDITAEEAVAEWTKRVQDDFRKMGVPDGPPHDDVSCPWHPSKITTFDGLPVDEVREAIEAWKKRPNRDFPLKLTTILLTKVTMLRDGPGQVIAEIDFPAGVNLVLSAPSGGQTQRLMIMCEETAWELIRAHIAEAEYWSAEG